MLTAKPQNYYETMCYNDVIWTRRIAFLVISATGLVRLHKPILALADTNLLVCS